MFFEKVGEKTTKRERRERSSGLLFFAVITLMMGFSTADCRAEADEDEIPFAVATLYFELNDTDGDLGIHALIDGEPWKTLKIEGPNEKELLDIRIQRRLRRQGLTEIFFESAEPGFDELSPEDFFRRFPEGEYEIEVETLDRQEMESTAWVTHVMPAPPDNISLNNLPAAEDCDAADLPAVSAPVIIRWDPVTPSHPEIGRSGVEIDVEKYQVVVSEEDLGVVLSVDLPPTETEFEVPEDFTNLSNAFKFEILVRETNGNQTAVESCFTVE
jgi:hypothetical protein